MNAPILPLVVLGLIIERAKSRTKTRTRNEDEGR